MENMSQSDSSVLLSLSACLLPLLSFLLNSFVGNKLVGRSLALLLSGLSVLAAALCFGKIWNAETVHSSYTWFTIGNTTLKIGFLLNNLSVLMLLLVSFIALLVHIYSIKYMDGDKGIQRYWAHLGLFCFAMLGLVIADNLLLMYVFWELVGFASYLLIGFWFTRPAAVQANKKAFIVNRIGDIGFLIGIMIMLSQFRTLDLQTLFGDGGLLSRSIVQDGQWIYGNSAMPSFWLTIAGIAFFMGAVAKSAQFPLHAWLPDAMEGPTAVSSLIHAATMVAAGVFLLSRVHPVFNDTVLAVITITGTLTAFMAASIALVQNDIKRILAFSTISQLGYMILAMGINAQSAALFHLVTHAFFKCLLFLCAGAIIHELGHLREKKGLDFDPQDIRLMGGLRKRMPVTFWAMLIASMALVGLPLSSGYLSKDSILISSFQWAESRTFAALLVPAIATLTSWFTAFYVARLFVKVFLGDLRLESVLGIKAHIHEAPPAMRFVLCILPLFCLFPLFSFNPFHAEHSWLFSGLTATLHSSASSLHIIVPLVVNIGSVSLIIYAWRRYRHPAATGENTAGLRLFLAEQWYINHVYSYVVKLFLMLSRIAGISDIFADRIINSVADFGRAAAMFAVWLDRYIVDGFINGLAWVASQIARFLRHFQSGRLQHYFVSMLLIVLIFFIYKFYNGSL